MTNKEHTDLRVNLTNWSTEDLHMVKSLVEVELFERDARDNPVQFMERLFGKTNALEGIK